MGVTVFTDDGNGMKLSGVLLDDGDIKISLSNKIYLDSDLDTYFTCAADDILDLYIAGSKDFIFKTNTIEMQVGSYLSSASATAVCYAQMIPNAVQQSISGPGAVTTSEYNTAITTTGADAFTLANGDVIGQIKRIQLVVDAGAATLTPTTLQDGTTITYADIGDVSELQWQAAGWKVIALYNCADGTSAPILA